MILQLGNRCNIVLNKEILRYNICWVNFSYTNVRISTKDLACAYINIFIDILMMCDPQNCPMDIVIVAFLY